MVAWLLGPPGDLRELVTPETGINITLRLSAFILLCIGVQIIWGGVQELWSDTALAQ